MYVIEISEKIIVFYITIHLTINTTHTIIQSFFPTAG